MAVSNQDMEESVQWTAEPSDRKIEMADKKEEEEENVCGTFCGY